MVFSIEQIGLHLSLKHMTLNAEKIRLRKDRRAVQRARQIKISISFQISLKVFRRSRRIRGKEITQRNFRAAGETRCGAPGSGSERGLIL